MQEKLWEYRNKSLKREDVSAFAKRHGLPAAMAVILMNRGIGDDKVEGYMKKSLEGVHNPFLFNDMEEAAERILRAVKNKEKTVIYGDYDVDGVTSTALLYRFLRDIGADIDYYIPDRFKEGYGVNIMAVNRLARAGTKLMITVDCGITSIGEVAFAKTQGMDVVVTDHHTCKEEIPKATAVINPKRADSGYPFDGLAGVGVAFKLVLALAIKLGMNTKQVFTEYADLAAIGTVADVVPLCDENRIIVSKGLKAVENTKNIGITALLEASGVSGKSLDSTTLAFTVAPRLNVAGRLEHAKTAVELLTCDDKNRAREIAAGLSEANGKRRKIEQKILDEALKQAEEKEQLVYVLSGEGWQHGVIGIVASRICEKLYRPCVLISCENGKGKGSGRSIEEFNLFDALQCSDEFLTAFGGHAQAAGLSLNATDIEAFRNNINEYAKKQIGGLKLMPKVKIDCNLSPDGININSAKMLSVLEPFGAGNENPVFSACGLKINYIKRMGDDGKHLRMTLASDSGRMFTAVGFGMGECAEELSVGDTISVAFTMNINIYNETESLQLMLKDIRKEKGSAVYG